VRRTCRCLVSWRQGALTRWVQTNNGALKPVETPTTRILRLFINSRLRVFEPRIRAPQPLLVQVAPQARLARDGKTVTGMLRRAPECVACIPRLLRTSYRRAVLRYTKEHRSRAARVWVGRCARNGQIQHSRASRFGWSGEQKQTELASAGRDGRPHRARLACAPAVACASGSGAARLPQHLTGSGPILWSAAAAAKGERG